MILLKNVRHTIINLGVTQTYEPNIIKYNQHNLAHCNKEELHQRGNKKLHIPYITSGE